MLKDLDEMLVKYENLGSRSQRTFGRLRYGSEGCEGCEWHLYPLDLKCTNAQILREVVSRPFPSTSNIIRSVSLNAHMRNLKER